MNRIYVEPQESEAKYLEYEARGKELKLPVFKAYLDLTVRDIVTGKLLDKPTRRRSHSWNRNAYNLLCEQLMGIRNSDATFGAGLMSIKDTSGTIRNANAIATITAGGSDPEGNTNGYMGAVGDGTYGIQVGTGNTAESFEHYALTTPIVSGNGAGQLAYQAQSAPSKSYDAPSKTYSVILQRLLNNNSGGSITVNEVGLIAHGICVANNALWYTYLMSRDLATQIVANAGQLTVAYTLSLVFPA